MNDTAVTTLNALTAAILLGLAIITTDGVLAVLFLIAGSLMTLSLGLRLGKTHKPQ
jgi:hypothetical protein